MKVMTPFVPSSTCTWAEVKLTISVATILHCFGFLHSFHLSHKQQRSSDVLVQEVSFDASLKLKFSKTVSSMALSTEVKKQKGKKNNRELIDVSTWPSGADQMSPLGLQDLDNIRSH
jgi:hypothetical protein